MTREKLPFELCNRYSECSVNNCPLDPLYPERYTDSLDLEQKCGYAKSYRVKISEQFSRENPIFPFPGILKYGGMTVREFNNKQRWDNMPEEEKQKRIQRIAEVNARRWGTKSTDHPDLRDVSEVLQE